MRFPSDAVTFVFNGEARRDIPDDVTHVIMHESITSIPEGSFHMHPNIVEVYCHIGVKRIEQMAFSMCEKLRRVVMPGVEVVERNAFFSSDVRYVECDKLERIGEAAFGYCFSLRSIDLPSAKIVEQRAFKQCQKLVVATFGDKLESLGMGAFIECYSLERITIPLKHDLFEADNIFRACFKLSNVDIVKGDEVDSTIDALNLGEWRNDMNRAIRVINERLRHASAGFFDEDDGDKAMRIREWITTVRRKFIHYKALHHSFLDEVASTFNNVGALPNEIVMNSVLPFLELSLHTSFSQEEDDGEEDDSDE